MCVVQKSQTPPVEEMMTYGALLLPGCRSFRRPAPSFIFEKYFYLAFVSPSSVRADATQAPRTSGSRFQPFSRSESSPLSRRDRPDVETKKGEERGVFLCQTLSGLLSLFTLRLGNSFRFSRISCREREETNWHN